MNACTIVAKNYVAHARVLARSFREHHPDGRFWTLVLDDFAGVIDPADEPFEVITPFEIGLDEFLVMAGTYDVLELSTAVKPWLLRTLLHEDDHIVYLDPDIEVHDTLEEIAHLAREHGMVLTPHNVAPMPRDGRKPSEADILIAGAYNLGFIGLGAGDATSEFLDWWAERLRTDCIVDPDRGYFVDQRWIDLAPGLVPSFHLLRDPGYNVAYWNLWTRDVQDGEGRGPVTINGSPLKFLHLSGYDPRKPDVLSKHQDRIVLTERPALKRLTDAYGRRLLDNGFDEVIGLPYTYARTPSGIALDRAARRLYAAGVKDDRLGLPLFTEEGEQGLIAYAKEAIDGRATRYMHAIWDTRPDLQGALPERGERLAQWVDDSDARAHYAPELLPAPVGSPEVAAQREEPVLGPSAPATVPFGVNLVGYLSAELGVGEVARQVVGALDAAGVPVLPQRQVAGASRQGHDFAARGGLENPFAVNLLCVNADMTPVVAAQAGEDFFRDRFTVGWWWWEVQSFPAVWQSSFERLDEVWVGSRFVADALLPTATVPVVPMPMPVTVPPGVVADRPALGWDDDTFVYLFAFDFNSVFARKNPLDLVEAFTRAYPTPDAEPVRLVLKAINGERHPEHLARLRAAIADRDDVQLIDRYLSVREKDALTASCDCYVSLHRSEGFGIGMAEATLLGRPVVATGYGGNVDFMGPPGGWLVRHTLVPIGPGSDPYPADAVWAQPDLDHAAELLRAVREQPEEAARRADAAKQWLVEHHSPHAAGQALRRRLETALEGRALPTAAAEAERALAGARDAAHRGPAPMPGRSAKKAVRAVTLRGAAPVLNHQADVAQHLSWGLEQAVRGLREELKTGDAEVEARLLAALRRVDADRRAADADARRQDAFRATQIADLVTEIQATREHLAGLQAFAERFEGAEDGRPTEVDGDTVVLRPFGEPDPVALLDELRARGRTYVGADGPVNPDPAELVADLRGRGQRQVRLTLKDAEEPQPPFSHAYNAGHRALVRSMLAGGTTPDPPYGAGYDERVVEYPWLQRQAPRGKVLDAGSVLNHAHVLDTLPFEDLTIVTLEPEPHAFVDRRISYVYADLRVLPFADATFDDVVCLSTLEHVGMDNTQYGVDAPRAADAAAEAIRAARELRRVVRPGGRILLSVPFGAAMDLGALRQFDLAQLDVLLNEGFGPAEVERTFFGYGDGGWREVEASALAGARYRLREEDAADGAGAARGVACCAIRPT